MPTISDVARAAGVGIGTVSRVLNASPLVSEATRQRVVAAIERLGYRPSPIARAFGGRRTQTIELLVPLFVGSFFVELLRGIEVGLATTQYSLVLRTIEGAEERQRVFDDCCARGNSDGALVVWMVPPQPFVERMTAAGFPAVLLNVVDPRLWSVAVNHDTAAEQAVRYCLRLGHRRIALVDRLEDAYDTASRGICLRGYRQALGEAGLGVPADYERLSELTARGGAAACDSLLRVPEPPTAIVAASDAQAVGIVQTARTRGWRVPGDLSVVGYNDSAFAEFLGLTTVQVPIREIGRRAATALLGALAEPGNEPETIYLPTDMVVRQTCGPPQPLNAGG